MKDEQKTIFLGKCSILFRKHGIKDLTMDDIAKELGMSKKTIYQYVTDKSELVHLSISHFLDHQRAHLQGIMSPSKNSVDEIIEIFSYFITQVQDFNPSISVDMKKYYPLTWNLYINHRLKFMLTCISDNLKNGVAQGVYRSNLDTDVISKLYIAGFETLVNQALFPTDNYVFISLYQTYIDYHLRAIVSAKGYKYLEKHNLFTNKTT